MEVNFNLQILSISSEFELQRQNNTPKHIINNNLRQSKFILRMIDIFTANRNEINKTEYTCVKYT